MARSGIAKLSEACTQSKLRLLGTLMNLCLHISFTNLRLIYMKVAHIRQVHTRLLVGKP